MYEKLLSETEKFIEAQKQKEIPILEVWGAMAERAEELKFVMPENLGDFEFLLEADKRFIFIKPKVDEEIEDVDLGEEEGEYEVGEDFFEVEKMEKLGFNQDQIISLKKYEKKKSSDDDDDVSAKTPRVIAGATKSSITKSKKSKVVGTKKSSGGVKKKSTKSKSVKLKKRKK
ncbi:MAG TPA: hypothetical protein DCQ28_14460 [Bacteroidetes bacterium]|nr:hypothetical protein [Bacteroidota bacterium]